MLQEFAIRRRMGLKEIQMQALKDVQDIGKLNDQQMKWLMSEHQNSQKALEGMYDEEISKQRMALEEKLAKRKAIAQAAVSCPAKHAFALLILLSSLAHTFCPCFCHYCIYSLTGA